MGLSYNKIQLLIKKNMFKVYDKNMRNKFKMKSWKLSAGSTTTQTKLYFLYEFFNSLIILYYNTYYANDVTILRHERLRKNNYILIKIKIKDSWLLYWIHIKIIFK